MASRSESLPENGSFAVLEALEPRPQADVRRERGLRLHANEPFDRLLGCEPVASKQHLPREQRAVERSPVEQLSGQRHRSQHRASSCRVGGDPRGGASERSWSASGASAKWRCIARCVRDILQGDEQVHVCDRRGEPRRARGGL